MSNAFEKYYQNFRDENRPKNQENELSFAAEVPFELGFVTENPEKELGDNPLITLIGIL